MKMDIKKVGAFLKQLTDEEYVYMQHCMGMRDHITRLIKEHNLTKEDICERFQIKPAQYKDFVKGNRNYDVRDLARLNAAFMDLETEKLSEKVPVQISTEKA